VNRFPKWLRTALLMIAMARATAGGIAGPAHARSKLCNTFAQWVRHDNDMVIYWAQAANAALAAGAYDEYQYDISKYNFYVYSLTVDGAGKTNAGC
jgi:hypothetical protein